jgi:aryl-alcohol dehydrogenase-like predicted oxidoreductase
MPLKIVLGTANFGSAYGFDTHSNSLATVDKETARAIVVTAHELGITQIDTAITYGPAQNWLSEFPETSKFQINTKIPWEGLCAFNKYSKQLIEIRKVFKSDNSNLIQWHNWKNDLASRDDYLELFSNLESHSQLRFGVTTYGREAVKTAIDLSCFSTIQLEFNVLNQGAALEYKNEICPNKPLLYMRSIFLQGYLTDKGVLATLDNLPLGALLSRVSKLAREWSFSIQELAIRSTYNEANSGFLVVGVNSPKQLQELTEYLAKGPLPKALVTEIRNLDSSANPVVDPRNWIRR